jgi:hypothetical protein
VKQFIGKLVFFALIFFALVFAFEVYRAHHSVEAQLEVEKDRNAQLLSIVQRLSSETRVADILVTSQSTGADGKLSTELRFVEYDHQGNPLPARQFVISGQVIHIDALVVKFEGKFVEENDPLRGHSVALFSRIYGDHQSPDSAELIDQPGQIPPAYRGGNAQVSKFESQLWKDFWQLADDPAYRSSMGVRVAQGEGVYRPFQPGYLYTLTLETNGGLNITSEKLRGIFSDLIPTKPASY